MFGLTPAPEPGNPSPAQQVFPKQLQIRFNGVDLGGPDATVLDFVGTQFDVSRAGGVVTVEITAGSPAPPPPPPSP